MAGPTRIRLRRLILISLTIYLCSVLVIYYYLEAKSFRMFPNMAYRSDYVDLHDLGDSILALFQPNGYVRLEYVFDGDFYKGWVIYPYVDKVTEYWEPGTVNISIYTVDVAPHLVASYVFGPGYEESSAPPSNGLIASNYGVREIRIIYLNEGDVPIELIIGGVTLKIYPDIALSFYSVYQWFLENTLGIRILNPGLGLLLGIFLAISPILIIVMIAIYLAVHGIPK